MASRSKRFIAGVLTGYGSIAANVVFTMVSIPLALHYLDKEHFGLWALALQINGYLALIDLGMSGAVSRFLADFKDDVNGGKYGSHLLTGGLVFLIQGLLIALAGMGFSWFAPGIFAIPEHLSADFRTLLMILSATAGTGIAMRSIAAPLWSFQRNDVINGTASIGLIANLALLWCAFQMGFGVMSFALAQIPVIFGTIITNAIVCLRNSYYPSRGHWGNPNFPIFKHMFFFGKDLLMITLGTQLLNATQIMIISRWVSLDAAAVFSVSTKFFTMAMLLVANPISASASGMTELYVRGEQVRFTRRYWDLILLSLVVCTLVGSCIAAGNRSLVFIWTGGKIDWPWTGDLLLALIVILRNLNGCFVGLFGITKDWRPVRHIYLIESVLFVPLAIALARVAGHVGVLLASAISLILVTTPLAVKAATPILGSARQLRGSTATAFLMVAVSSAFSWLAYSLRLDPWAILATTAGIAIASMSISWLYILPIQTRTEVRDKMLPATRRFKSLLGRPG